jgi:hypothetical protein
VADNVKPGEPERFWCEATTTRGYQCQRTAVHLVQAKTGGTVPLCNQHWEIHMDRVEGLRSS